MIEFRALGSLAVTVDGEEAPIGGPRQRRLLAMLLIHRQSVVSVDRLADAVFAGEPTDAASTTMRSYVARIRKVIDAAATDGDGHCTVAVLTQAPGYALQAPPELVDIGRFEHLLTEGQHQLAIGDAAAAAGSIRKALSVWNGDAYAEFADEEWALPEAQRLEELRIVAHERLVEAELACGKAVAVIAELDGLVAAHPLREGFRAQLMTALYRTGRHVDALRAYREYRQYLADEVGLDPSPALVDLERRILEHDPSLSPPPSAGEPLLGYRLGERLGSGPNGTIHWARLPGSDREYAISILDDDRVDEPDFVRTFEAAAQQIASLRSPAIVPIHDHWRGPGAAYVVTRRIYGVTLRDRLRRGPMTVAEIHDLTRRVGAALVEAEQRGVRHGWLTLDNVVFDDAGNAFLVNFVICPESVSHDVADLADVIGHCVARLPANGSSKHRDAIAAVLARASAAGTTTTMAEFVDELTAALADGAVDAQRKRPNPFKGLRAFDEADECDFFGRDGIVDELLERLSSDDIRRRFTLVVGASGSGKSSLVRAGLLPRVRRGDASGSQQWFVSMMLPGSTPFKELEASLRQIAVEDVDDVAHELASGASTLNAVLQHVVPEGGQLLLVIDQFEELFTLAPEADQRAFLDCLADAVTAPDSRLRVVATMRADFYDRPLAFQRFGEAVSDATVAVVAMSPTDLEAAIVRPVEAIGATAEPALVAELVAAVVDQPAALPSLQFTLYELAERRPDRCLTRADYRELGGIDAAIASRADKLYRSMDRAGKGAVRELFEQLVVVGIDGEPTSRRTARTDLAAGVDGADVDSVIDQWTAARLLTVDNDPRTRTPTVQIAHEALIRTWPRLGQWIEEDRDAIMTLSHLRETTADWEASGRDDGTLYRGARLQNALDYAEARPGQLPVAADEFLAASVEQRDSEHRAAAEHTHRQVRANRRLRIQFGVIAVALVVALGVGFMAVHQRGIAERESRVATGRELAAASVANLDDDPERSVLLALAAVAETRAGDGTVLAEAEDALHQAVNASRIVLDMPGIGGRVDWSPSGEYLVTEGPEESGIVDLRDPTTGASVRSWQADAIDINNVVFSNDGSLLATVGDDGTAKVWDPSTGELISTTRDFGVAYLASFTADDSQLLSMWSDGTTRTTSVTTGDVVSEYFLPETNSASMSPDGTMIAIGHEEPPFATVVDAESGDTLFPLDGHSDSVMTVAWSNDGARIATGGSDSTARIWNADTGEIEAVALGHKASVTAVEWSKDGTRLATGSNDGTARLWEVDDDTASEVIRLAAQDLRNGVAGVAFSPDDEQLLVGDFAVAAAKVFDVSRTTGGELASVAAHEDSWSVQFTADGTGVLAVDEDGAVGVWNVGDGIRRSTVVAGPVSTFGLSPDGSTIASADEIGFPLEFRDVATGAVLGSYGPDRYGGPAVWSPDSRVLAVSSWDGTASYVDVIDPAGNVLASRMIDGFFVSSIDFDRDGTQLAFGLRLAERYDPDLEGVVIWDWVTDVEILVIEQPTEGVAFDPNGPRLVTSRFVGGTLDVWDTDTGEHLAELAGHTGLISDVVFSPDGTRIGSIGDDGSVRIWDASTLEQLQVMRVDSGLHGVDFSEDASKVATVDATGLVRVWTLDLDVLIDIALSRVTRSLTDAECVQYLHLDACPAA